MTNMRTVPFLVGARLLLLVRSENLLICSSWSRPQFTNSDGHGCALHRGRFYCVRLIESGSGILQLPVLCRSNVDTLRTATGKLPVAVFYVSLQGNCDRGAQCGSLSTEKEW